MLKVSTLAAAALLLAAGSLTAAAGPSCAALGGKSFVFLLESVQHTGIQRFERAIAAGRFSMAAGGQKGRVHYVTNGLGATFSVRDQLVECEGDDGVPPRLTLWRGNEEQLGFFFRQTLSGDLVLVPNWPHAPTGKGEAVRQAPGTGGLWSNACAGLRGRYAAALAGEDLSRSVFDGPGVSRLVDFDLKAGNGKSNADEVVSCAVTTDYGPGAARLTVTSGPQVPATTGALYAASRDRVLFIEDTPGRSVAGWFDRRP